MLLQEENFDEALSNAHKLFSPPSIGGCLPDYISHHLCGMSLRSALHGLCCVADSEQQLLAYTVKLPAVSSSYAYAASEVRSVLDDEAAIVGPQSTDFWILAAALKHFIDGEGESSLPLEVITSNAPLSSETIISYSDWDHTPVALVRGMDTVLLCESTLCGHTLISVLSVSVPSTAHPQFWLTDVYAAGNNPRHDLHHRHVSAAAAHIQEESRGRCCRSREPCAGPAHQHWARCAVHPSCNHHPLCEERSQP